MLAGTRFQVIHSYATVPLLALTIDVGALAKLQAAGQVVVGVWADTLRLPTLPQSVPLVGGDDAFAAGYDGSGNVVAIVDTGVDNSHPFLLGKVIEEACYSSTVAGHSTTLCPSGQDQQTGSGAGVPCPYPSLACWHGTHVAGIAAGSNGVLNGTAFSGVAKGAQIIAVQVYSLFTPTDCGGSSQCIMAWTSDIIAGLEYVYGLSGQYAISSANLSLGGGLSSSNCDDDPTKPIIDNLRAAGIATVIAAGNDGSVAGLSAPGCISSAVSVGSTTKSDVVSSFSNAASFMSLWAPGSSITSSYPGGQYMAASGTSMATPHVTGAFAVLRQAAPNATVSDILTALQQTGLPIADTRSGGTVTAPRIQIFQALQALSPGSINLTLSVATVGSGTVSSMPAGINCGSTCTASYTSGQQVTLTASASPGSVFAGWGGACAGTGTCVVTMNVNTSVTATFNQPFTLTVSKAGTGSGTVTSSPSGISCGSTCSATYTSGQQVTLTANPAAGSAFAGWSGACSGTGTCIVAMNANAAVTATFNPGVTLTVSKAGTGSGTVTSSPSGINCGSTCSARYGSGQQVTLTAIAAAGSAFAGWSGACSGTGTCVVAMSANRTVTATFSPTFTLTVSKAGAGSGTVTSSPSGINCGSICSASYASGQKVTLTATVAAGSVFVGWSGACSGTATCVVTMNGTKAVTAMFNPTFTLTVSKSGTGSGTVTSSPAGINCGSTCAASYTSGQQVTLTASAGSGSRFTGWTGACSGTGKCTVSMTAPLSVGATFSPR